jgi:Rho family protein
MSGLFNMISYEEGVTLAEELGAIKYMECSAVNQRGLNELFVEVIRYY